MEMDRAWEVFMRTGKIEDYLRYIGAQGQARYNWEREDDGGDPEEDADSGRGDCDTGAQRWRG